MLFQINYISFLGASCTAQRVDHRTGEITGYVEYFRRYCANNFMIKGVYQNTYPGNRFAGAGWIKLEDVIALGVDICILELLVEDYSRGSDSTLNDYLSACKALTEAKILPIFLNLPKGGINPSENWNNFKVLQSISSEFNVPTIIIEPPNHLLQTIDEMFNGQNHTKLLGAKYYAESLATKLVPFLVDKDKYISAIQIPGNIRKRCVVQLGDLASLGADKKIYKISLRIKNNDPKNKNISIIQLHQIGKFSPVIEVSCQSESGDLFHSQIQSLWDPFCHYLRASYLEIKVPILENFTLIQIKVSDQLPNYSLCKQLCYFDEFKDINSRYMQPIGRVSVASFGAISVEQSYVSYS